MFWTLNLGKIKQVQVYLKLGVKMINVTFEIGTAAFKSFECFV